MSTEAAAPQRLHVNQLGYLTGGPKAATLESAADESVVFVLVGPDGRALATGRTEPRGVEPTAGAAVHVIDFSAVSTPGTGLRLVADGATSPPFAVGDDLYAPLRDDAIAMFVGQRSGVPIDDRLGAGYARPAGHVDVAPNRGDGAVGPLPAGAATTPGGVDLYEGWTGDYVIDGRGGWYDAGDQGKYVVNGGIAVAQLLGLHERDLRLGGPGVSAALDEARFELEWMLRMQVPAGLPLAGMVHHKLTAAHWTPLPTLPHLDPQRRFLHRPSTAATANLAAVAAQGARVLAADDPTFAARLLAAARTAYAAALANPRWAFPDTNVLANAGGGPYDDPELDDELYWAAAELYLTTGEQGYLADLRANPFHVGGAKHPYAAKGFDWQDVAAWAHLQLATVPSALPERDEVRAGLLAEADRLAAIGDRQPFGHLYAPADDAYAWGSNAMVANCAALVAGASEVSGDGRHRDAALAGIDYLLGRNALGLSYVTGYGTRYAHHQHSRWYGPELDPALPPPPRGTLAGGPNTGRQDPVAAALPPGTPAQRCYVDDIQAFSLNEMTVNWNAALAWLAAFAARPGGLV